MATTIAPKIATTHFSNVLIENRLSICPNPNKTQNELRSMLYFPLVNLP